MRGIQVKKKSLIFMLGALMLLLTILVACAEDKDTDQEKNEEAEAEKEEEVFDPEPNPDATQISTYDEERINDQAQIDENLLSEYEDGNYSFEDPFIKVDPYDAAPLTALVKFDTEEPVQIKVTVGWEEGQQPIEKTWEGYETEQDRKSTRLNSSHVAMAYAVRCLKQLR